MRSALPDRKVDIKDNQLDQVDPNDIYLGSNADLHY
jgi:hypothetical protein